MHRHLGLAGDALDQALAAARDDHVDRLRARRSGGRPRRGRWSATSCTASGGRPASASAACTSAASAQVRLQRLRAAAQDAGVAALDRQRRGLDRHVRPALVDHAEHAERHAHPADADAARLLAQLGDLADRVGHRRDLLAAHGDGLDRPWRRACRRSTSGASRPAAVAASTSLPIGRLQASPRRRAGAAPARAGRRCAPPPATRPGRRSRRAPRRPCARSRPAGRRKSSADCRKPASARGAGRGAEARTNARTRRGRESRRRTPGLACGACRCAFSHRRGTDRPRRWPPRPRPTSTCKATAARAATRPRTRSRRSRRRWRSASARSRWTRRSPPTAWSSSRTIRRSIRRSRATPSGQWLKGRGPLIQQPHLRAAAGLRRRPHRSRERLRAGSSRRSRRRTASGCRRWPRCSPASRRSAPTTCASTSRPRSRRLAPDETLAPEPFVRALLAVIRDAGMTKRVMIQSFDWRTLKLVQQLEPGMQTMYLTVRTRTADKLADGTWTGGMLLRDHASPGHMVQGRGRHDLGAEPGQPDARGPEERAAARPQGDPVDGERPGRRRPADRVGRRRHHQRLPRPDPRGHGQARAAACRRRCRRAERRDAAAQPISVEADAGRLVRRADRNERRHDLGAAPGRVRAAGAKDAARGRRRAATAARRRARCAPRGRAPLRHGRRRPWACSPAARGCRDGAARRTGRPSARAPSRGRGTSPAPRRRSARPRRGCAR